MLDADTRRRIDTARNILVGKLPDPKSQVEQITIALIYKFMYDMDQEAVEMGGHASFFTGPYEKYAWNHLVSPRVGAQEALNIYGEALTGLYQNPAMPRFFRDVFKNAFLPYRDPETLKLFLKTIDDFKYDHTEQLGDAFEYLLSVLGSQGDAGQFRTPRHIIDFMVRVVRPEKDHTILDPACGTAGFLVSAYKYIQSCNPDGLSFAERKRLGENITGYDISPDMVRLSLVNLFLHGFNTPNISEYDTLTSLDHWNDYFDIILANPPFMSPKGGIRPHVRFSVPSTRSEILFVDYIAAHLTPDGRGAVIVPEGIIFQSGKAYKDLRRRLVENDYLWAVVSLPAGVFNPYSGVKTSILFFDRALARMTDQILFIKVTADGFDLGAQRRKNGHDDLPVAEAAMKAWQSTVHAIQQDRFTPNVHKVQSLLVHKARLAENGDYSLAGERYIESQQISISNWPLVPLGKVCQVLVGGTPSKAKSQYWTGGSVKWISAKYINEQMRVKGYDLITEQALRETSTKVAPIGSTILISRVSIGKYAYADDNYALNQDLTAVVPGELVDGNFLFNIAGKLASQIEKNAQGIGVRGVTQEFVKELVIPLPPLDVQRQIVAEIAACQRLIDAARVIVDNWKLDPYSLLDASRSNQSVDWKVAKIGDKFETTSGGTPLRSKPEFYTDGTVPWIKSGEVSQGYIYESEEKITEHALIHSSAKIFPIDTVLVAMYGATAGQVGLLKIPAATNQAVCGILPSGLVIPEYLYVILKSKTTELVRLSTGGAQPNISQNIIRQIEVPLPPLDIQRQIVERLESERAIVEANRRLIQMYEEKIQRIITRVWQD